MINMEWLMSVDKEHAAAASAALQKEEIRELVNLLAEKNDKIRYPAFLILQERSFAGADVYPYWDIFREKLRSDNSYQRNIGCIMIAVNTRWDESGRMEDVINDYLELIEDEKPITARQCIQSLSYILPYKPMLCRTIAEKLISVDLNQVKDTMKKLILTDIIQILAIIRETQATKEIDEYILAALKGDILDKKTKKQVENLCKMKLF